MEAVFVSAVVIAIAIALGALALYVQILQAQGSRTVMVMMPAASPETSLLGCLAAVILVIFVAVVVAFIIIAA